MEIEYIYVLSLTEGKYYVGKTNNVDRRLKEHRKGGSSVWTTIHMYKNVIYVNEVKSNFDEDNKVKELMEKYGMENVRGGSYSLVTLTKQQKEVLTKELRHNNNLCLNCGSTEHFITNCDKTKKKVEKKEEKKEEKKVENSCIRCKRFGHNIETCNAHTTEKGKYLCKATTTSGNKCRWKVATEGGLCKTHTKK